MPYRHAHYFLFAVLLVIAVGFWASYFARVGGGPMPLAFHVHAVSSMAWIGLLIAQHVAIHRRANALHRQMGMASFALFPLLLLGFMMILNLSAERYAAQESPFIMYVGPSFFFGMVVSNAAYLTLFYLAMKHRRNVKLHAGYMLATPMILFESPFSRIIGDWIPWMNVIGSEGMHGLLDSIVIGDMIMVAFAAVLYLRDRKHGAPWLVAIFFLLLQSLVMWNAPFVGGLGPVFAAYTAVPDAITASLGLAMGAAAGWLGWQAGKPPERGRPAMAA
ncbi:MAG: hypothetical protein V2J14_01195 [Erythrobacter sp.]|nr:hypothetical protein [Erythrobacter sp.]